MLLLSVLSVLCAECADCVEPVEFVELVVFVVNYFDNNYFYFSCVVVHIYLICLFYLNYP